MTVELDNLTGNNTGKISNNKNKNNNKDRYLVSQRTKEMFKELEQKYRISKGIDVKLSNKSKYRQSIGMVYDALKNCRQPLPRSNIINASYSNQKTQSLIKHLIMHDLIEPSDEAGKWITTEKGWELMGQLDDMYKKYPFIFHKE